MKKSAVHIFLALSIAGTYTLATPMAKGLAVNSTNLAGIAQESDGQIAEQRYANVSKGVNSINATDETSESAE